MEIGQSGDDQVAIAELLYRYGMAIDSLDREALAACFPPDADMDDMLEKTDVFHRPYVHTMHKILNHLHVVEGDVATGKTYCVCTFVADDGGQLVKFDLYFQYADERFEKRDGRWYMITRRIVPFFSTPRTPVIAGFPDDFWDLDLPPGSAREG